MNDLPGRRPSDSDVPHDLLYTMPQGRVVEKPWGFELWWAVTALYAAKTIAVRAGHALSLQYHETKMETLHLASGRVLLRLGDDQCEMNPGAVVTIPPGTVHRIHAITAATIVEVSTPHLEDVVRLEDMYGRLPR